MAFNIISTCSLKKLQNIFLVTAEINVAVVQFGTWPAQNVMWLIERVLFSVYWYSEYCTPTHNLSYTHKYETFIILSKKAVNVKSNFTGDFQQTFCSVVQ